MRPRLLMVRRVAARTSHPAVCSRYFTQTTVVRSSLRSRPRLPFLSVPTASRSAQRVRYLTTERKARIKYEVKLGIKYTAYIWVAAACVVAVQVAIMQERLERQYPTPHEWTFLTRLRFCGGNWERYTPNPEKGTSWLAVFQWIEGAVERLEDPKIDGRGLKEVDIGVDWPPGVKDISSKSEEWRRGYFETVMLYAKAAENMDGWVRDMTNNNIFPSGVAIGPSNPRPLPLPAGFQGAPREENCKLAFKTADEIYSRLLLTKGLTTRQKMEAQLAYASWLEFKGQTETANTLLEDAVKLSLPEQSSSSYQQYPVNRETWALNNAAGLPSANLLTSLTAYATFKARHGEISSAMPMLVSILRARRSLPDLDHYQPTDRAPPPPQPYAIQPDDNFVMRSIKGIIGLFSPPPYPPPPPDGTSPPPRDAKARCEEAALSLHIGEIMYTSQPSSREEGLGWTREAVDIAEEQLHSLSPSAADAPARTTCRECLATGLDNWSTMVAQLAREESAKKDAAAAGQITKRSGWLGLWGQEKEEDLSRWAAEEKVIQERQKRAARVLEELPPPNRGFSSLFSA